MGSAPAADLTAAFVMLTFRFELARLKRLPRTCKHWASQNQQYRKDSQSNSVVSHFSLVFWIDTPWRSIISCFSIAPSELVHKTPPCSGSPSLILFSRIISSTNSHLLALKAWGYNWSQTINEEEAGDPIFPTLNGNLKGCRVLISPSPEETTAQENGYATVCPRRLVITSRTFLWDDGSGPKMTM